VRLEGRSGLSDPATAAALFVVGLVIIVAGIYYTATRPPMTGSTSTSTSSPTTSTTSSSSAGSAGVSVEIPKGAGTGPSAAPGYAPDKITLVIGVNNTVTWTNDDTVAHTVTSVSGNGTVSSGNLAPGATYTFTFPSPGTYDYYCEYHSWMAGTVVVEAS
jgi:plastocyanin